MMDTSSLVDTVTTVNPAPVDLPVYAEQLKDALAQSVSIETLLIIVCVLLCIIIGIMLFDAFSRGLK